MKTPITDAEIEELSADKYSDLDAYIAMSMHARRLELDRAALIEALEDAASEIEHGQYDEDPRDLLASAIKGRAALSAARANFPEQ
jgi:hypothetical protein